MRRQLNGQKKLIESGFDVFMQIQHLSLKLLELDKHYER